jgi:hypothetical protein
MTIWKTLGVVVALILGRKAVVKIEDWLRTKLAS